MLYSQSLDIDLTEIWTGPESIEEQVRETIKRRNNLIHSGSLDTETRQDLFRLRKLVTLTILKILECPGAALNPTWLNLI